MQQSKPRNLTIATMFNIQDASRIGMVMGIFTMILGLLSLIAPTFSGMSINLIIAVALVAAGVARLVFAFKADSFGRCFLWGLLVKLERSQ